MTKPRIIPHSTSDVIATATPVGHGANKANVKQSRYWYAQVVG
jgi:hypothetical protein